MFLFLTARRKVVGVIVRDRDASCLAGISSQCDWLKALRLVTVALVYYLE